MQTQKTCVDAYRLNSHHISSSCLDLLDDVSKLKLWLCSADDKSPTKVRYVTLNTLSQPHVNISRWKAVSTNRPSNVQFLLHKANVNNPLGPWLAYNCSQRVQWICKRPAANVLLYPENICLFSCLQWKADFLSLFHLNKKRSVLANLRFFLF